MLFLGHISCFFASQTFYTIFYVRLILLAKLFMFCNGKYILYIYIYMYIARQQLY